MNQASHTSLERPLPQRKKIFFFRGCQLWYVTLVSGSLIVLLAFTGFHAIFVARTFLPMDVFQKFEPTLHASTWRLFGVGAMYIGVVSLAAMFISHRMVGPAHRLAGEIRRHVQSTNPGTPIRVREGDELEDVVQAVNELIEQNRSKNK